MKIPAEEPEGSLRFRRVPVQIPSGADTFRCRYLPVQIPSEVPEVSGAGTR